MVKGPSAVLFISSGQSLTVLSLWEYKENLTPPAGVYLMTI